MFSRRTRIIFYIGLFLLVLCISAWGFLAYYHDSIRLRAERYIDSHVKAFVTFDHVSVTFLEDFPSVTKEAALNVLEMAKASLTSEKVLNENFA